MTTTKQAIAALVAAIERRNAEFLRRLDAAEPEQPCPRHPDRTAFLDHEAAANGEIAYVCQACEDEKTAADRLLRQDRCGIPQDVRHATFDNYDFTDVKAAKGSLQPRDFLRAATELANGGIRNLILAGTVGIGKGHLAAAVVNAAIAQGRITGQKGGRTARWVTCHWIFSAVHTAYGREPSPEAVVHYYANRDLLILDECAMSEMPKDGPRILFDIIDARQKNGLWTILLSNQPAPVLKAWLTEPVVDRLRSGGLKFCWGEWPSRRGTALDGANQNPQDF